MTGEALNNSGNDAISLAYATADTTP